MSASDNIEHAYHELWDSADSGKEYYVPEKYQLGLLTDFLEKTGAHYQSEVKVGSYPIDLVAIQGETIITIEMKSKDISRGIEQACRNSDFVDFSFLALWEENITDNTLSKIVDLPIGLLSVGNEVNIVSSPMKTEKQLYPRDYVLRIVNESVREQS
ncbi:hypothetical protein [Haloferax sp. Atlit-19N]|uniref:hypothetical protein n=1 Tax=Haloferax sp. Atlit-19N TaxID=2077201 RepID=UPI0011C062C8|nr:hypothetical protein [Haloferax sp. Atlit-19N]